MTAQYRFRLDGTLELVPSRATEDRSAWEPAPTQGDLLDWQADRDRMRAWMSDDGPGPAESEE